MVHFRKNKKSTDRPIGPRRLIIQNFNLTVMIKQYSNKIIKSFNCTNVYEIAYIMFVINILQCLHFVKPYEKRTSVYIKCQDQLKANNSAIILKV